MKTCTKCGIPKPLDEFRKLRTVCKECIRKTDREGKRLDRKLNPEKHREVRRRYIERHPDRIQKTNQENYRKHRKQRREQVRTHYEENREKVLEQNQLWAIKNRKHQTQHRKEYRKQHPEKRHAHNKVDWAIKTGKLIVPDVCESSDETCRGKIEAHHPDYSKPLDVNWLCKRHHAKLHRTC